MYSTDARLMQKISTPYLPIVLLHRTGFTASFLKHVISLVQEGLSMSSIARHIQRVREQLASETALNFISDYLLITHQQYSEEEMLVLRSKFETIVSPLIKPFPTNDIIAKYFLISFEMAETFYIGEMLALKVRHCIRLYRTFKIASNIGYLRDDKKWITQYGTVFFVINEDGQGVTWQLTNPTSLDEVAPLLCSLRDRMELPKYLTVYVDMPSKEQIDRFLVTVRLLN